MHVLHLSENPNKIFSYADPIPVVLPQDHISQVDILDCVAGSQRKLLKEFNCIRAGHVDDEYVLLVQTVQGKRVDGTTDDRHDRHK